MNATILRVTCGFVVFALCGTLRSAADEPAPPLTRTDEHRLPGGDLILQFNHPDRQDRPTDKPVPSRIRIWIPGDVPKLRGIIFDLGYTYTSDRSDLQAVARAERWAVIGCLLRYKGGTELLNTALDDFARRSNHPELRNCPIVPMGFSRNGSRAWTFLEENPSKTIALALGGNPGIPARLRDGTHLALAQATPALTVVGSRDPFVDYNKGEPRFWHVAVYPAIRGYEGVEWGMMIGWGLGHGWQNSWSVFVPYFQECFRLRAPGGTGGTVGRPATTGERAPGDAAADGQIALKPIRYEDGWYATYPGPQGWEDDWPEIAPVAKFSGDRAKAIWLPSADVAHVWRAYEVKQPKVKLSVEGDGKQVVLTAEAPAETTSVEFFDRARSLGTATQQPYRLTTDQVSAGVATVYAVAKLGEQRTPSRPQTICRGRPIDWQQGEEDQKRAEQPENVIHLTPALRQTLALALSKQEGDRPAAEHLTALRAELEKLTKDPFVEQRTAAAKLLKAIE